MFKDVTAAQVAAFHDECLATPHWTQSAPPRFSEGIWQFIELNHRYNCQLWDEEDLARRRNVADTEITKNKRAIDGFNQKRNDAIECIDESLLVRLASVSPAANARLNSETAGSMIDRMSIVSLKIFHMRQQTQRTDVDLAHIETCKAKLARLMEQRGDLGRCLDALLADAQTGKAYFKIYRQFKMYNDPKMNPVLVAEAKIQS